MPVENDLKAAYKALYDDKDYSMALGLYDSVLKENKENLTALIYKTASLEKLYYSTSDWHNQETLSIAKSLLEKALDIATKRGDRARIALVNFRFFVYYFHMKKYQLADEYMIRCREYDYKDDTLPMWEMNLQNKLKKLNIVKMSDNIIPSTSESLELTKTVSSTKPLPEAVPIPTVLGKNSFKTDWYQTSKNVTISLFTETLPVDKESIKVDFVDGTDEFNLSYIIPATGSEFQYNIILSHPIENDSIKYSVYTKKIEIVLTKKDTTQWKSLERKKLDQTIKTFLQTTSPDNSSKLTYPNSSKKKIDWSKIDIDDEDDNEGDGSADAFFQQLYAGADPDTKRAMMKSFLESNGTSLNTNWDDVSKGEVTPSPPDDMELKRW